MQEKKQKKVHLDILRVIAIFGVMFVHSDSYGIYHYQYTDNPVNFWFGFICATLAQFCVPLFFMISGALLLKKEESIAYVYKHRVLRIFLVITIIAFITLIENYFQNPEYGFNIIWWFQKIYEGALRTQYWYLYEYLGFLMILPFLQRMVKTIPNKSWYIYLYFIYLFFNCICPIFSYTMEWSSVNVDLKLFVGCIFYSVMGYFVENASEDLFYKGKNVLGLFLITAAMLAENLYLDYSRLEISPRGAFCGLIAPFYAFFLFVFVRYICYRVQLPLVLHKVFAFASVGAFGTYLLEQYLREMFFPVYVFLNTRILSYPATFAWLLVCLITGVVISNLIKKIPWVGKLL